MNINDFNSYRKYILIGVLILAALLVFVFIGRKEKTGSDRGKPVKTQTIEPVIAKVDIIPAAPITSDFIRAVPELEDPGVPNVKYQYQWYLNGSLIHGEEKQLLAKDKYKKGDRIYCRVRATRGVYESQFSRSKEVKVENAPPVITITPVESFNVPGIFHYNIQAEDPDGDSLTYQLLEPLDLGIEINPETGVIRWDIQQVPTEDMGESNPPRPEDEGASAGEKTSPSTGESHIPAVVKIVFEVRDSDGAATAGSINLNLERGSEIPQ